MVDCVALRVAVFGKGRRQHPIEVRILYAILSAQVMLSRVRERQAEVNSFDFLPA
jgi:hypothetical protein